MKTLKGRNPITTNFTSIISIQFTRPSLNFNDLPKLTVMKMINLGNDLGLFYTNVVFYLLIMFYQSWAVSPTMIDVSCMLLNPVFYGVNNLYNIGGPIGTWDYIKIFQFLGSIISLIDVREIWMVFRVLKLEGTLCYLRIQTILLVVPEIKRSWTQVTRSLGYFFILVPLLAFKKTLRPLCLLYPLFRKL